MRPHFGAEKLRDPHVRAVKSDLIVKKLRAQELRSRARGRGRTTFRQDAHGCPRVMLGRDPESQRSIRIGWSPALLWG